MKRSILVLACAAAATLSHLAVASEAPAVTGVRAEYLKNLADVEDKVTKLAAATPAEKYAWRPSEGVRSISEVYMHIVGGNYFLPTFTGYAVKPPEWFSRDSEKTITDKAKVTDAVKGSFAHLRQAIAATEDSKLDTKVKTFLGEQSVREVYLLAISHAHEHLGQSIAYARMNGIAPPWSEGPPPAAAKKDDAKGVQQASGKDEK